MVQLRRTRSSRLTKHQTQQKFEGSWCSFDKSDGFNKY